MQTYAVVIFLTLTIILSSACAPLLPEVETMPPKSTPSSTASSWWQPQARLSWQWQINGTEVDTSIPAAVYDIDLYVDPDLVAGLHTRGVKTIGYISVGSWEKWRPDVGDFAPEVLGNDYEGWPGERWLDIRRIDLLAPILRARLDLCKESGFDAVEPDNMEIYTNPTGFPLIYQDQLEFARWLAQEAHARGLAIGQKNAPDQIADLVDLYDFAITEDCFVQGWCQAMLPYIAAGKPVFAAEYTDTGVDFAAACAWGKDNGFSFILKNRDLGAWVETCP
jgi:hypothetical protein